MSELQRLAVRSDGASRWVTLKLQPPNLMTTGLLRELDHLVTELEQDEDCAVVVFESSNPEFFICHSDLRVLSRVRLDETPPVEEDLFLSVLNRLRRLPMISVVKLSGRVGGSGAGLAEALDMRFGIIESTVVNRMEVPLGMTLGGGTTKRLVQLLGLGRALEMVCAAQDLDAWTLERWGWLNHAWPAGEFDERVHSLVRRLAGFSPTVVRLAKSVALMSMEDPTASDEFEHHAFWASLRSGAAVPAVERFLALGGQTVEGERRIETLVVAD